MASNRVLLVMKEDMQREFGPPGKVLSGRELQPVTKCGTCWTTGSR